ncbi:hypothetical protein [Embleya scabrispora]|uniref:hypothetical protein n=1 Tax=Embleya scabrispora TaxID=159449 RepID=UPI002AA2A9DE|nr:hypothetical protein [Embleya scabrispora]
MTRSRALASAIAAALPLLALAPSSPAAAAAVPGESVTAPLSSLIAALPVRPEGSRDGYGREQFKHWVDADRNGCSTRNEVLLAEAVVRPEVTGRCTITAGTGQWWSWYDETTQGDQFDVDIDHMVPLGEAWDSSSAMDRRRATGVCERPRPRAVVDRGVGGVEPVEGGQGSGAVDAAVRSLRV